MSPGAGLLIAGAGGPPNISGCAGAAPNGSETYGGDAPNGSEA